MELRTNTVDELGNYLRIVDFEYPESEENVETQSLISTFEVINSKEGDYLVFHREDGTFRVFNLLLDLLHLIDRRNLIHLYQLVLTYSEEKTRTGVGLVFLGDLTTLWKQMSQVIVIYGHIKMIGRYRAGDSLRLQESMCWN